ncbi:MAG: polysaccharide deacetylase family protein [Candidatus Competibacteraceae bacterium]|nr:MAG: polysaccharide deacetylase family protein [Candidatus Competibacteraceae bacterium]
MSAFGLTLALVDASPGRTWLLTGLAGFYIVLLAVGALVPCLDFYLRAVCRGSAEQPWVALTFDDGPDPAITPLLLELLRRERIRAVFFYVGEAARQYPALVAQAAADGHLIGNHSNRHGHDWAFSSTQRIIAEFEAANRAFTEILGYAPRFARTPVGASCPGLAKALARLRLGNIAWDVRGLEGLYRDPTRIATRIVRRARNGSIILLHELYYGVSRFDPQQVLETAQLTIDGLRARGFCFVRLDRLLAQPESAPWPDGWESSPETGALLTENGARESMMEERAAPVVSRAGRA